MFNTNLTFEDLRRMSPQDMLTFDFLCMQEDTFDECYAEYLPVIQDLMENGIDSVVDIGCAAGVMAYMFRAAGIRYVGIECCEENLRIGEIREPDGSITVIQASWPCEIPEAAGIDTCICLYSIGSSGIKHLAQNHLKAIKKRFQRMYLATSPDVQTTAQMVFGPAKQWVRPSNPTSERILVYGHKTHVSHASETQNKSLTNATITIATPVGALARRRALSI